jgi:23S rRNA pseudouridine1911/1915/1917 synthase
VEQAPSDPRNEIEYEVEPNYAGWTLHDYVAAKIPRLLPHHLDKILRGKALVHPPGLQLLPETRIWPGLRFALRKRAVGDDGEPAPLRVVHQDEALLVVDKPAGLALHPTARYHLSTLTRALELHHRDAQGQKPDPAHRLDRDTSGLVACGRHPRWTRRLKRAFAEREVEKRYLALVEGAPEADAFEVDLPLKVAGESGRVKVKMLVAQGGAPSVTACAVVARYRDGEGRPLSLLRCTPRTGRQHQLRAHLAAVGLPLVGDKLYGPDEGIFLRLVESGLGPAPAGQFDALLTKSERAALRLPRHALHAEELVLPHPESGERLRLFAPLPGDLSDLLAGLTLA